MYAKRWKLGERRPFVHLAAASGREERYCVQLVWSPGLGLRLKDAPWGKEELEELAGEIERAGIINIERWEKFFLGNPRDKKRFSVTFSD